MAAKLPSSNSWYHDTNKSTTILRRHRCEENHGTNVWCKSGSKTSDGDGAGEEWWCHAWTADRKDGRGSGTIVVVAVHRVINAQEYSTRVKTRLAWKAYHIRTIWQGKAYSLSTRTFDSDWNKILRIYGYCFVFTCSRLTFFSISREICFVPSGERHRSITTIPTSCAAIWIFEYTRIHYLWKDKIKWILGTFAGVPIGENQSLFPIRIECCFSKTIRIYLVLNLRTSERYPLFRVLLKLRQISSPIEGIFDCRFSNNIGTHDRSSWRFPLSNPYLSMVHGLSLPPARSIPKRKEKQTSRSDRDIPALA